MRRTIYLVILLVLGLLLTPSPSAQTNSQYGKQTGSQTDRDRDRDKRQTNRESKQEEKAESTAAPGWFLKQAAIGNLTEVKLGQLAAQKASSAQVKQFAQQMVDAHNKANDQIQKLAQQKNIQLPTDLDRVNKRKEERLSKLSGAEFDRAYMQMAVQDHREDVDRFEKASKDSKDADVRNLATSMLPELQQHLQMATTTRQQVAGTKTTTKTGKAE